MTEAIEHDKADGPAPGPLDSSHIMQVGMGFWPSKALLSGQSVRSSLPSST